MDPTEKRHRLLQSAAALLSSSMAGAAGAGSLASIHAELDSLASSLHFSSSQPTPSDSGVPLYLPDEPVVIQAIVEPIGIAPEGKLIQTLGPAWDAILAALAGDPETFHRLTPRQLEELIAASYERAGFDEVILTPHSGDFGRDVIAIRHGLYRVRLIDQVKHFSPGHRVGANDVRALIGVLASDPRATKGYVTTTSTFAPEVATDPFISPHIPFRLELVDGPSLSTRLLHINARASGDA